MGQERISTAQWILERQLGWIGAADAKVAVVVAIDTALLASLAAAIESAADPHPITVVAASAAFLLAVVAIFFSAMAVIPRTSGPASILFFGEVAKYGCAEYAAKLRDLAAEELLLDWSQQIHRNAQIAVEKHKWVRRAMIWSFAAGIPWVVAVGMLVLP